MPAMWEAEMYRDEVDEEGCKRASEMRELAGEKMLGEDDREWQDLVVSVPAFPGQYLHSCRLTHM